MNKQVMKLSSTFEKMISRFFMCAKSNFLLALFCYY
ncbi:hypothetical protein BMETH_424_1 [methanotrophic bacterial endosymbiont of Bathymodiolus sp.]|nr:hypothetical protein BMETH_424_1 [methanotrophic bacterial endosymbiont of Bathymodiolus sp.]